MNPKLHKSPNANRRSDLVFRWMSVACAGVILALIVGFLIRLTLSCGPSFQTFGWRFLTSGEWNPPFDQFGALSTLYGTAVSTLIALVIAVPLSLVIALFLVELAPPAISKPVGTAIELLAAIPSIIYGMWGMFVLAPLMAQHVQPFLARTVGAMPVVGRLFTGVPYGSGMLTAGIILALMVLPFISAVMRDVFAMVPAVVKESAYGMGATTWEVTRKITVRYGIRGLMGACFLGLGRAVGETMAVTFVIGNQPQIKASLFEPAATISSLLANQFNEASEGLFTSSLIELGLILLVVSLLLQVVAHLWLGRVARGMGAGL